MAGRIADERTLPTSHVFLTAAWGCRRGTVAVPRWAAAAAGAALLLVSVWSFGCTVYVLAHDSLLAAAMRRERDLQYGFEDRIATLQRDLERTTTEGARMERSVGARLEALSSQEADLRRRAETMAALARDALRVAGKSTSPARPAAALAATGETGASIEAVPTGGRPVPTVRGAAERVSALMSGLSAIAADQDRELAGLRTAVAGRIDAYRDALEAAGLTASRFARASAAAGGPFVPLDAKAGATTSAFDRASLALQGTLAEAAQLHDAVAHTPFDKPLEGDPEITSPFGARVDPFLGRPALHTGLDLKEDTGTAVLATAPGRVAFAGQASGYGTMVEIDHGNGLSTRYAHLSAVTVDVGEAVATGAVVGRVGATGRATGPHLHYETRIDGEPVDPMRFLQAGHRLAETGVH